MAARTRVRAAVVGLRDAWPVLGTMLLSLLCALYVSPMPNRLSWHFHHLPKPVHRLEVLGNHFALHDAR